MTTHWHPPDVLDDILAIARRPGVAEPVEIRIRPEVRDLLVSQGRDGPVELDGIRLVVDEELPAYPGYEIHRALPGPRAA
ncbi:hypothetical protein ACI797_23445 [Geodermatophilus sp. SYSU D00691]